jgi:hypothetical protein
MVIHTLITDHRFFRGLNKEINWFDEAYEFLINYDTDYVPNKLFNVYNKDTDIEYGILRFTVNIKDDITTIEFDLDYIEELIHIPTKADKNYYSEVMADIRNQIVETYLASPYSSEESEEIYGFIIDTENAYREWLKR